MDTGFKFTDDQLLALKLIGGAVKNLLLFGGSRSGKVGIVVAGCDRKGESHILSDVSIAGR